MEGPSCCCFSLSFLSSVLIHSAIHFCRVFPALCVFVSIALVATSPPTAATRLCDFRRHLSESTSAPTWHIQTNSFQLRYLPDSHQKQKQKNRTGFLISACSRDTEAVCDASITIPAENSSHSWSQQPLICKGSSGHLLNQRGVFI